MNLNLVKVLEINTVNKHSPCLQLGNSQSQWTPRKEVFIHYLVKILEEPKMFASSHSLLSFTFNLIKNGLHQTWVAQSSKNNLGNFIC